MLPLVAPFIFVAAQSGIRLTGTANEDGIDETFSFISDGGTRFVDSVTGPIPDVTGYDGKTCWSLNVSGVPHSLAYLERDVNRLVAWIIDGEWNRSGSPVTSTKQPDGTLKLAVTDGHLTASLTTDAAGRPAHLNYWTPEGDDNWSFDSYRAFGTTQYPTRIEHRLGSQTDRYVINRGSPETLADQEFAQPPPSLSDTTYDSSTRSTVDVKRVAGYTFVHPLVDGKDVGWFFFDTGAGGMCLDPAVAKSLNAIKLGTEAEAGVVAAVQASILRTREFRLGPISMKNPTFIELDLAPYAKAFGVKIAGICGYDFLARCSFELDPKASTLMILKPGEAQLPLGSSWTHLEFDDQVTFISCRFEGDHEGIFAIDSGSGSNLDFTTPAVEKYGFLKDRKLTTHITGGAGGSAQSKSGKLAWFEIGGQRLTDIEAGFQITKTGVFASPYFEGNIGAGILGRFKLIVDYSKMRVAFVPSH